MCHSWRKDETMQTRGVYQSSCEGRSLYHPWCQEETMQALGDVVHNHRRGRALLQTSLKKSNMNIQPPKVRPSLPNQFIVKDEEEHNSWIWGIKSNAKKAWLIKL